MYWIALSMGLLLVISQAILLILMFQDNELLSFGGFKSLFGFFVGVTLLVLTLPSLKYFIQKDYDVISGDCTIEVESFGRRASATFNMIETNEQYDFFNIPELDAYGSSIPYYCKMTVTKDHKLEIGYEIYDAKSRKLLFKKD